jgi:uncharacterized short protein YbdD (DUF466 family)
MNAQRHGQPSQKWNTFCFEKYEFVTIFSIFIKSITPKSFGTPWFGQNDKNRFVEHLRAYEKNHPDSSALAYFMFFDKNYQKRRYQHEFDFSNLKLVQSVPNQRKLDFLETFHIL